MLWVSGHGSAGQRSATIWVRAPDAASAEHALQSELSKSLEVDPSAPLFVVLAATRLAYSVSIGIPEEDAGALDRVLAERRRETGSIGGLIATEPSAGLVELTIDADVETDQGAEEAALADYRQLRAAAGLPPADPSYTNVYPPWRPDRQRHRELSDRAQALLDGSEWSLAVMIAQAAIEVLVRQVVEDRLRARRLGGLRAHLNRYRASLQEQQTRKLWLELTNDEIGRSQAWKPYLEHVDRRNQLVHEGLELDEPGATASITAVRLMIEHIETLPQAQADDDF